MTLPWRRFDEERLLSERLYFDFATLGSSASFRQIDASDNPSPTNFSRPTTNLEVNFSTTALT